MERAISQRALNSRRLDSKGWAVSPRLSTRERIRSLRTPLVAVLSVLAASVLFLMWLGFVVVVMKALIG